MPWIERWLRQSSPAQADVSAHFFRDYNRLIGIAYGLILIGLTLFFGFQLREGFSSEIELIESNVRRHSLFVENVIRSSTDQLDNLQMLVADQQAKPATTTGKPLRPPAHWPAFEEQGQGDERYFSLDKAPDIDLTGNLVGEGSLVGRSPEFYADIDQTLLINSGFRSLIFTLPNAARARFLGTERFLLSSPWRPASVMAFGPAAYVDPIWDLGSARVNPEREKRWAPAYFGGKDRGLLVPVVVPVYRQQRLVGVLAIDTSLDYLNRVYSDFGYPLGSLMLVDAFGQVLAHPASYADPLAVEKTPTRADVLPPTLKDSDLSALPNDAHRIVNGEVVIVHRFIGAPWTQFYIVSEMAIWRRVLANQGWSMLATFVGLVAVMLATYLLTSLQFVGPASKLVRHLAAESRFQPAAIPKVPMAWKPWFETVSKAFRESIQLMGLRKELDVAAKMQSTMLPHAWPVDPRYELWGVMQPAKDVGGDFYDHFSVGEGLRGMTVADVSGKGIGPGLFGMMAKTLLRVTATQTQTEVTGVVEKVNDELCVDNDSCMFVTLVYALFNPESAQLTYCNAGHPAPLRIRADGSMEFLSVGGGMALGVMEEQPYSASEVHLQPGDTVLIYSDGVTEAMNQSQEEFGFDRLSALFAGQPCHSARDAVERVVNAVHGFAQGVEQSDDITCIALVYMPQEVSS